MEEFGLAREIWFHGMPHQQSIRKVVSEISTTDSIAAYLYFVRSLLFNSDLQPLVSSADSYRYWFSGPGPNPRRNRGREGTPSILSGLWVAVSGDVVAEG